MLTVILIGLGVSIDAMCVSITLGLTAPGFSRKQALMCAGYFGVFQMAMPLAGSLLAGTIKEYVDAFAPYISFFILALLGSKTILDSGKPEEFAGTELTHRRIIIMAVATSLDALAIGIGFTFMDVPLLSSCVIIGLITFCICLAGALLGGRLPVKSQKNAGILGGLVLIGIGVRILIQGVFL